MGHQSFCDVCEEIFLFSSVLKMCVEFVHVASALTVINVRRFCSCDISFDCDVCEKMFLLKCSGIFKCHF